MTPAYHIEMRDDWNGWEIVADAATRDDAERGVRDMIAFGFRRDDVRIVTARGTNGGAEVRR